MDQQHRPSAIHFFKSLSPKVALFVFQNLQVENSITHSRFLHGFAVRTDGSRGRLGYSAHVAVSQREKGIIPSDELRVKQTLEEVRGTTLRHDTAPIANIPSSAYFNSSRW